ncbi:MAG: hypothetical protein R3Y22_03825 [Bacteroidales bacterium]
MKIDINKLPQIKGVTYQKDRLIITKDNLSRTCIYERIETIEMGDNLFKIRLVNDVTIAIELNPYRIIVTQPILTIDLDELPEKELELLGFTKNN